MKKVTKSSHISYVPCSVRTENIFASNGIKTVGDLCSRADLYRLYGMSRHVIDDLRKWARKHGLSLAVDKAELARLRDARRQVLVQLRTIDREIRKVDISPKSRSRALRKRRG